MRSKIFGFFAALAAVGCSDTPPATVNYNQTGGSAATSGGSGNTSGGSGNTSGGSGGSSSGAGGVMSAGGTGGSAGAAGGSAGSGGSGGGEDVTAVKASAGCGKAAPVGLNAWVEQQIFVDAEKADFTRKYYVRLPEDYNQSTPYRIIYQGPGCTGLGYHVYPFQNVSGGDAIQIGLEPQPGVWENNCFDDKEGDDSIEWPFFEAVHSLLKDTLCIDENRVFASGNSSGAWLGNELACKYAKTIIRGIAVNTGGLPADQAERPTCGTEPFAGFWIHDAEDNVNPFSGNQYAIERAIQVNGCQTTFDAERDPYPITVGAVPEGRQICEKFRGCPANYPIVLCTSHGQNHGGQDDLAIPAMWQFMSSF